MVDAPARRIARGLRALAVVEHAHQRLYVALRLHARAHHAEAHHRLPVLGQERGNDGVKRPFARRHHVGAVVRQAEAVAAVLQADAEFGLDAARAKAQVVALDEADHHAAFVRRRQVDGAALRLQAGPEILRLVHADESGTRLQVRGIEHLRGAHRHPRRLGHGPVNVGKGQLYGLDLHVLGAHAVGAQRLHVEVFQHAERHQRGDALRAGPDLVQLVAAVADGQRIDPFGLIALEVAGFDHAALRGGKALDGVRDLAAVEGHAARGGNALQGLRRGGKTEQLTDLRRAAPGHEGLREAWLRFQLGHGSGPFLLHHHRHGVAAFGDVDGRRQHVGQRQTAKALVQLHPRADGAGHRHAVDAALGRRISGTVFLAKVVRAPLGGRTAGGVQAMQLLAVPQDAEGVAAQAIADRFADRHGRRRRHGGIDRVAALLQHAKARLRRQRVRGGDHVAGEHRQSGGAIGVVVTQAHGVDCLHIHRGRDDHGCKP